MGPKTQRAAAAPRTATRISATSRPAKPGGEPVGTAITARGEKTRQRLIKAAREVFEEVGFVEARIIDITKRAGTASGSFYNYFSSKEEILDAAALEVYEDITAATHLSRKLDPVSAIEAINEQVLDAWFRNRKMLMTLYQVAGFRPEFFARLNDAHRTHQKRFAARLRDLQKRGLVHKDIDPDYTAVALDAMVEQSLRWWIGSTEQPFDRRKALAALNHLWIHGIGLDAGVGRDES